MFYRREQMDVLDIMVPDAGKYHSILESIGEFAAKEVLPHAKRVDQEGIFPRENLAKEQARTIMAMPFPTKMNGLGYPFAVYVAALELLAKACANTALQVSVQAMVCEGIRLFGSSDLVRRYLSEGGLVGGRKLAAFALTEPCCGSDARSLTTSAATSRDGYLINGTKTMISNAGEADFILLFARTEEGISCFVVPKDAKGLTIMKDMPKLGLRGATLSTLRFDRCEVAGEDLLGEKGKGLDYAKEILNAGRMTIGAVAVGIAQAAYERSLSYSKRRKAFGRSISDFQLIQEKLSGMATDIGAARLLVTHAASLKDKGKDIAGDAARAKLFSTEMALRVCDAAIQIHGGYGYLDAHDLHRHWRDARGLTIGEGTSDMLRLFIAHLALKEG